MAEAEVQETVVDRWLAAWEHHELEAEKLIIREAEMGFSISEEALRAMRFLQKCSRHKCDMNFLAGPGASDDHIDRYCDALMLLEERAMELMIREADSSGLSDEAVRAMEYIQLHRTYKFEEKIIFQRWEEQTCDDCKRKLGGSDEQD